MTDPTEDELRRAMQSGAARFNPTGDLGATRAQVVGGVRSRQRQVFALGVAVVLLVSAGIVAAAAGGSGSPASRQVAARGAGQSAPASGDSTTIAAGAPGVAGGPTGTGVTSLGSGTPPATAAVPGHTGTTRVPPATTATTAAKGPPGTPPSTTVLPTVPEVQGTVRFSPVCPVERIPPDPACVPRPGAAHIQMLRSDGTVAAEGDAGSSGDFTIPVAPGTYTIKASTASAAPGIGRGCTANPAEVTVGPDRATTTAVSCDTGIR